MASFSLVFVVVAVILLLAAATEASTKAILTTTTLEENPTGQKGLFGCAETMVEQEMLSHCRMYLSITGRSQTMANPAQEHLQLCCKQLENMGSEECMCQGIKMMMNIQRWTQQGMGEMVTMALNLPQQCNLMSQSCQMQPVLF